MHVDFRRLDMNIERDFLCITILYGSGKKRIPKLCRGQQFVPAYVPQYCNNRFYMYMYVLIASDSNCHRFIRLD